MVKKSQSLLFFFLMMVLQLTACAEDDPSTVKIDLHIKDHKFVPQVIELPANKRILITLYNDDPTTEEFESWDLKREKAVPGNSVIKIILAPLRPGEYEFFGDFNRDTARGKIIVKDIN